MNRRIAIGICAAGTGFLALLGLMKFAFYDRIGRRLLHMEVYQNDQLVLLTMFDAPDHERAEDFWRRAGLEPFASDPQAARVKADEDNPLRASLTGPVRIRIVHVNRLMTSVSLTNLILLRGSPESPKWYLAPEEIQRARRAASY